MKNSPLSGKNLVKLVVLVAFFAFTFNNVSAQQKVVGGVDVDIKDYPWQVAVDYGCGGSIIGDSWVLTAAHCVGGGVNYIYAGNSAPYASGGETYSVVNVITHPLYGVGTSYSHDYALVEIEGEFNFSNPNIGKIDLISEADVLAGSEDAGVMSTITGWGTLSSGGAMASTLQMVQAPIVANDVACGSATDENGNSGDYDCSSLDGSMVCAGDLIDGGEDACQGDSGGPLVVRSLIDNRWLLIGATSWGYGCADVNYPGVWSRVSYVLDWIEDNADVNSEYGCIDVAACNFDPEAIFDDGSCAEIDDCGECGGDNSSCSGCMDVAACNFDPQAIFDDGSCAEIDECGECGGSGPAPGYDCDGNCVTGETLVVEMSDSYGDGWDGSNLVVNGVSVTLSSGSSGSETLCFDSTLGCNEVTVSEGSWPSEVSWTISDGNGNVLLTGGAPYSGGFGAENCGPPVPGCTDPSAINYLPIYTTDDGSCEYPIDCSDLTSVLVEVTNGSFPTEVSWELGDFNGGVGSTSVCLEDGCISFKMLDSYGDGWNGSTVTIFSEGGEVLLTGTLDSGSEGVLSFALNFEGECGPIYGCTDSNALNYDEEANTNDGSCEYPVLGCTDSTAINYNPDAVEDNDSCEYPIDCSGLASLTVNMLDSYGDGWNGNDITINGQSFTIETGSEDSKPFCYDPDSGCIDVICDGGTWQEEVSWTITDLEGNILLSGGAPFIGAFGGEGCGPVLGCTDATALNYNEEATTDDGSCEYPISGCTDSTATNFNFDAVEDDGSCQYPIDCSGLTAVSIDVGGGSWQEEVSWSIGGFEGVAESIEACLEDGCLTFTMLDSYGDGWNGNIVTITSETGDVLLTGTLETGSEGTLSFGLNFDGDCGPAYGCTDSSALNYNEEATADDGSCQYPVAGCTDSTATNFNPDAVEEDGSCEYPVDCSGLTNVTIEVTEGSYDYEVSWSIGDLTGETGTTTACLEDGCLTFNMIDSYGDGWNGSIATITSETGELLLTGTLEAGFKGVLFFALNDECGDGPVYGCTDSTALNYNENANTDDGSCDYDNSGCSITEWQCDNGECIPASYLCDGANIYTGDGYEYWGPDCDDGSDESDCGWTTDEIETGCTDSTATNYNPTATVDDGSCEYDNSCICPEVYEPVCGANGITYSNSCFADCDGVTYSEGACDDEPVDCEGLSATLTLTTFDYASEISWSVVTSAGEIVGSGDGYSNDASYQSSLCLEEGVSYSFEANDSFNDGWHGAYFFIETNECVLATGGSDFTDESADGSFAEYPFTASCGDIDPCAAVECAEGYECVDGDCILIDTVPWDVYVTGTNHTIVIDGSAVIDLGETTIEAGDALGVFFTDDNGDLQCAGQTNWTGSNGAIAAQGDDSTTDELDGFASGSEFVWMVWDASEGVEIMVLATYNEALNDQGNFVVNGYSALAGLTSMPTGPSEQLLSMPDGWSNFSTYMSPENMDMGAFLSPIISDVIIAKDNAGLAYLPEWNFNGIGDLQVGQGYQVKLSNANELLVVGEYMSPEDHPIDLSAGWNMIGYLRTEPSAADAVLADITSTGNLVIAKDYSGNAYLPEWNFNGIGDMVAGEAYQLKINNADVLQYLSNDDSYRMSATEVTENNVSHFAKLAPTDNNMTVVIEDAAWDVLLTEGAEIAAFDKNGNMVGSAIYSSPVTVVTVWGDDATSTSKDGMLVSESVSFKVWNTNEVSDFTVAKWIEGSSSYQVDGISVASTIETNNVMTELNASERVLVKVINVLGQEVNLDDESFKGTVLFNVYDDGSVEKLVQ